MVAGQRLRPENPHQSAAVEGVGPGLGREATDQVPEITRASGPPETPDVRRKPRRVGGLGFVLWTLRHFPVLHGA